MCISHLVRSDWWLVRGVSKFVAGLFCRKSFGNTDYLFWVREEQQKVCLYEAEHSLPPLCGALPPLQTTASSTGKSVANLHAVLRLRFNYKITCIAKVDFKEQGYVKH